ncbi:phosphate signaling complex protein PhoU [Streptococcus minor]|uniref:Phosphate-specific transport system accessory protein PhoU n=1 Tax=Streptococcus minor TaxID=229549 RepID=A0A3P1VC84_9STRE|nr:phosphate signaling complex protein PhoU [Streptococcus minor]RRD31216.1 phosphate signaling complex protein PhoU [Streptococcus minor]
MIRSRFEHQLHDLNTNLIVMGTLCEDIISKSLVPLKEDDFYLVNNVNKTYQKIDQLERDIEEQCLKLLLRQQPVAKDLRRISAALKMVYDMKRIGAQSAEIAEIIALNHIQSGQELLVLRDMASHVIQMVTNSIDAFVHEDEELAQKVIAKDDYVDQQFDTIKVELIRYFTETAHSGDATSDGEHILDILMVAKYLERIGDHTVNIAKWVIFSITGQLDGETT